MINNVINPILTTMCDRPGHHGSVGTLLRNYAAVNGANAYYAPTGWWREATVQATFYRFIQALNVASYLVLSEQPYADPNQRADIMVVDLPNGEILGIELKATFAIGDSQADIDKLASLLDNSDIDYGLVLFVATANNFANWRIQLQQYSIHNSGGAVYVGGVHT